MNRRQFLKGCASFGAMAATRGFGITSMSFGNVPAYSLKDPSVVPPNNRDLLLFVFVRGAMDGLNMVVPFNTSEADRFAYYNTLRPTLNIPAPNDVVATRKAFDLDGKFGLHPDMARGMSGVNVPNPIAGDTGGLAKLFADGNMTIVDAAGTFDITGSHFDTQDFLEAGGRNYSSGWIARYMQAMYPTTPDALAVAPQSRVQRSLSGWYDSVAIASPATFGGVWNTAKTYNTAVLEEQRGLLLPMYGYDTGYIGQTGVNAFAAQSLLGSALSGAYTPSAGVAYTNQVSHVPDGGTFASSLQIIARLAKSTALTANPLRVATIDVGGGWDTHDNEGTVDWSANTRFPRLVTNLSNNLKAFYDDLSADPAWVGHFTVIVVSEFGRVRFQNASGGCDHGAGNAFFVIGHNTTLNAIGSVQGNWPGLTTRGFNDGLQMTTDYRLILAEALNKRMGASLAQINTDIFPGLNFSAGTSLNLFK